MSLSIVILSTLQEDIEKKIKIAKVRTDKKPVKDLKIFIYLLLVVIFKIVCKCNCPLILVQKEIRTLFFSQINFLNKKINIAEQNKHIILKRMMH